MVISLTKNHRIPGSQPIPDGFSCFAALVLPLYLLQIPHCMDRDPDELERADQDAGVSENGHNEDFSSIFLSKIRTFLSFLSYTGQSIRFS